MLFSINASLETTEGTQTFVWFLAHHLHPYLLVPPILTVLRTFAKTSFLQFPKALLH
jgi:hypothetical protein